MKKTYSIYLFRHGQTAYNRDKRFTGFHDPQLTKLGIKQAKKVAEKLKNKKFQVAIFTRLKRSKQTLNEVLKYHPECSTLLKDDRMIERNYGKLNGITHENFIRIEKFKIIHRSYNIAPPNGESFAMVETRVKSFIKDLKKIIKKKKCNVVISAHGNSIRIFRKIIEKASPKKAIKWNIPYDKFYEYKIV